MGKAKKPAKPAKQVPHYDQCKARWEKQREERKAKFAEAQRKEAQQILRIELALAGIYPFCHPVRVRRQGRGLFERCDV